MARPRDFDTQEVLGLALEMFRDRGFKSTSYADLEEKTGVKKASLVAAYGDKHAMFLLAIKKYQDVGTEMLKAALADKPSAKEAIWTWLTLVAETASSRGCLAVNTLIELADSDPIAAELLTKYLRASEKLLAKTVQEGVDSGEFRHDISVNAAGKYLMTCTGGLNVISKSGLKKKEFAQIVDVMIAALI